MIDKNFYLENLSAFDILIQDEDRKPAEEVIFRVYSMLQRDKIWLGEVATEEEIFEEDVELLEEVDQELKELDEQYDFRFEEFNKLVQQEMKKLQSNATRSQTEIDDFENKDGGDFDVFEEKDDENSDGSKEDFEIEEDLQEDEDFFDENNSQNNDVLSHLSDEEIDMVPEFILASAKTRFNYPEFLDSFPVNDEFFVEEEFLFPIIVGKAFGETSPEICEKIYSAMISDYSIEKDELLRMIEQKGRELGSEILAFKVASDSLQQGAHPKDVVAQIAPLLRQ